MRDIEDLEGRALVCGDGFGERTALRGWKWRARGVLDYGAELGEGRLCEELDGNADGGTWH